MCGKSDSTPRQERLKTEKFRCSEEQKLFSTRTKSSLLADSTPYLHCSRCIFILFDDRVFGGNYHQVAV